MSLAPAFHTLWNALPLSVGWIGKLSSNGQNMAGVVGVTSKVRL